MKNDFSKALFVLFLLCLSLGCFKFDNPNESPPVIVSIDPSSGAIGDQVHIYGKFFGDSQGSSKVTFNGVPATVTTWEAKSIGAYIPSEANPGINSVVVTVDDISSNSINFTVFASIPPEEPQPPSAPQNLTATPGNTIVTLRWDASSMATGYRVYMGSPDCTSLAFITSTTGTSVQVTGLTNGTQYCFVVRAFNADGESANSNQATATPVAPLIPDPPTNLTAVAGFSIVTLNWQASTGADGYNVYMGSPDCTSVSFFTTTTGTTVQVTGLSNGTQYCFVVRAYNAIGTSGNSNQALATPSASAPSAPSLLGATPSTTSIILTWSTVPAATGYNVYMGTRSGSYSYAGSTSTTTATTFTVSGLSEVTIYYFVVTATNSSGESIFSNELIIGTSCPTCSRLNTNYVYVINAFPAPGTILTTTSANNFSLATCYTLTDNTGTIFMGLFTDPLALTTCNPSLAFAITSQTISMGSGTVLLSIDSVSIPPAATWMYVGICVSNSTNAIVARDTVPYQIDSGDYIRITSSSPADGAVTYPGTQTITINASYNLASSPSTNIALTIVDQNATVLCNQCNSQSVTQGSGTVTLIADINIPLTSTIVYAVAVFTSNNIDDVVSFPILTLAQCGAGQYVVSNPAYSWDTIADPGNGTQIYGTGIDDASSSIKLPFTFSFYCLSTSTVAVSTNGLLSFAGLNANWGNVPFPSTDPSAQGVTTPYWDDLTTFDTTSEIRWGVAGTAPNRRAVITWTNMRYCCGAPGTPAGTFQAILYEGTNQILFQYQAIDPSLGSPTVGLNWGDGILYNSIDPGSLTAGTAILFQILPL